MVRKLFPYVLTVVLVGVTTLIKLFIFKEWVGGNPVLLYLTAIILSTWYGGRTQGVLATALALILATKLFMAHHTAMPLRLSLFVLDSVVLILLSGALRDARRQAHGALAWARLSQLKFLRSDLRFRRVFESEMLGLLFIDSRGVIVDCNTYILKLFNSSSEDFGLGKLHWHDLFTKESIHRGGLTHNEFNMSGHIPAFETELVRRDGIHIQILLGGARLNDGLNVAFVLDNSEAKKNERELAASYAQLEQRVAERTRELTQTAERLTQSQKFLDSVVENIPDMVFVKEARSLRCVRLNKFGRELLGIPREEWQDKGVYDFFPKPLAVEISAADLKVLEGRVAVDVGEQQISTKNGLRYVHTKKIPILNGDGEPAYLLGISEDITERKVAEKEREKRLHEEMEQRELMKSMAQLRFLSDASASLNEGTDLKTTLNAFANTVIAHMADWCEIILLGENEMKVQDFVIAHRDPQRANILKEYRRTHLVDWGRADGISHVLSTGTPLLRPHFDLQPKAMHQKQVDAFDIALELGVRSVIVVPLQSYGRVIGALTLIAAESERVYNELDLSVVTDLAKRVSFAIDNWRLFSKAQEASQAKSAFLANMSHEIRTPLGAMLGFAELLSDDKLLPKQRNYLDTLIKNGRQLLHIVDEILDLSKVESDHIQIEMVEFSLPDLIAEVMALLRVQAEAKKLIFHLNPLDDLPARINSDPTRIRQILVNIIGNAIKFTEHGEIDVRIELHPRAGVAHQSILEISIRDSGIGIAPDKCDKLFQPFVQADNSMTRRFGGTGLGLFLSRRLARLLGGDVILGATQLEKGSQFIITLGVNVAISEMFSNTPELESNPPGQPHPGPTDGEVLIVDDSSDNRTLMRVLVSRLGLSTDTAASGREAVNKALSRTYGLILMDVQMPEMDGFEAVNELRARNYHGPIVALTAHTMKGDRERCLEGGFDDYLGKPINRDLLRQSLGKFISPQLG